MYSLYACLKDSQLGLQTLPDRLLMSYFCYTDVSYNAVSSQTLIANTARTFLRNLPVTPLLMRLPDEQQWLGLPLSCSLNVYNFFVLGLHVAFALQDNKCRRTCLWTAV